MAERLQRGGAVAELLAGALRRKAIGKMLLARGAAVAEILLAGALMRRCSWQWAPWRRGIGKQMLVRVPRRGIGKQRQRKKPAQGA